MSFLAWAFALGTFTIGFPIVFHLLRRTPRGRQDFSSIMFLQPSPPRLTRRSRLDNLLLLLLRALAIVLLAAAFMRPFLRGSHEELLGTTSSRRVAILMDTSASMRRGDLWQQAIEKVQATLGDLDPTDDVALFTFDKQVKKRTSFADAATSASIEQPALVGAALDELEPTWHATDLGSAMLAVARELDEGLDAEQHLQTLQLVLVTDLQQGASIDALQGTTWPENVLVSIETVSLDDRSNANVRLLTTDQDVPSDGPHVRVSNSPDSATEQFFLRWAQGNEANPTADPNDVAIYVPPGKSQVIKLPRGDDAMSADRVLLIGEDAPFDNAHFVVPMRQETMHVVQVTRDEPNDKKSLRYYLQRALLDTPTQKFEATTITDEGPLGLDTVADAKLVVISTPLAELQQKQIATFLESGGTGLVVLQDQTMAQSLGELWSGEMVSSPAESAARDTYALFGQVDFLHPLFAPLKGARFNDFTKIRFWQHRRVRLDDVPEARVVASFDDGYPAIWEQSHGKGTLFLFASGWHPADSNLALSTKFVPLLSGILDRARGARLATASYNVGDAVTLTARQRDGSWNVLKPDGTRLAIDAGQQQFQGTDQPGVYRLQSPDKTELFAVNVAPSESQTMAMGAEQLEQHDVRLGDQPNQQELEERALKKRDKDLESQQKIWKWLIAAALCVVVVETGLARPRDFETAPSSEDS